VSTAPLPEPHHIQARLAFGGGASDHGRALGLVVAVERDVVTVRFPLRTGTCRYQVDCRKRLRGALRRRDLLKLGGRPVVIVSNSYDAIQLPYGPTEDAARMAAGYGVVVPPGDLPVHAGASGGVVFNVRLV
jgi:hypothetical protein